MKTTERKKRKISAYTYYMWGVKQSNCYGIKSTNEKIKRLKKAEYNITKAIVLDEGVKFAFYVRAGVRKELSILSIDTTIKNNYLTSALEDINEAIYMDDRHISAYKVRAEIKVLMGDDKGAEEDIQTVEQINSEIEAKKKEGGDGFTFSKVRLQFKRGKDGNGIQVVPRKVK